MVLHALIVALILANPEWLDFASRVIRLEGEDYDLRRNATMLTIPPPEIPPAPADRTPLPEPPLPAPPPPPPDAVIAPAPPPAPVPLPAPLPPPPVMPPVIIGPDDVLADGARPEAPPRASRGNTPDPARAGSLLPALPPPAEPPLPAPAAPPAPTIAPEPPALASIPGPGTPRGIIPPQIAQNANPNALRLPALGGGRAVENAIRNAAANPPAPLSSGGRTGNNQGLELPNFSTEEPQILSDTRGYDFGPYLNQVVNRVRMNWYSGIPESVRFNGQRGRVVLTFTIVKSGAVQNLTLRLSSGSEPLDRPAMGSITASNPFPRLPASFDGDHLTLQFTFLYNYPALP
jgi:TonB family protein